MFSLLLEGGAGTAARVMWAPPQQHVVKLFLSCFLFSALVFLLFFFCTGIMTVQNDVEVYIYMNKVSTEQKKTLLVFQPEVKLKLCY